MLKPSIQQHRRKTPKTTHTRTQNKKPLRTIACMQHSNAISPNLFTWKLKILQNVKITWFNLKQFTLSCRALHSPISLACVCGVCVCAATSRIRVTLYSYPVGFGPFIKRLMKNVRARWKRHSTIRRMLDGNVKISDCISQWWSRGSEAEPERKWWKMCKVKNSEWLPCSAYRLNYCWLQQQPLFNVASHLLCPGGWTKRKSA